MVTAQVDARKAAAAALDEAEDDVKRLKRENQRLNEELGSRRTLATCNKPPRASSCPSSPQDRRASCKENN